MKKDYLFRIIGRLDESYIDEASDENIAKLYGRQRRFSPKILMVAACLALTAAMVLCVPLFIKDEDPLLDGKDKIYIEEVDGFVIQNGDRLIEYKGNEINVEIPDKVKTVANFVFLGNKSAKDIETVTLGANTENLEYNAFAGLTSLIEVLVPNENGYFEEKNNVTISTDGRAIIQYNGVGEEYTIPESVEYIAAHAFQGSNLKRVNFNDKLLYIGYNAFASCPLAAINLPDSVIELAEGAFSSCIYAIDGHIPKNVKIGDYAFSCVPFYNTLLAGETCPWEAYLRNEVTLADAFELSNREVIAEQINSILGAYNAQIEDIYIEKSFAYGAILERQPLPEGVSVPTSIYLDKIEAQSGDLAERSHAAVVIECEGDYNLRIGFMWYGPHDLLHWEDSKWCASEVKFEPKNASATCDEVIGDWYITYLRDNGEYKGLTFTKKDGSINFTELYFPSSEKYVLQLSPDGEHFIVEYSDRGYPDFFIEALNGETYLTGWSFELPCIPYYGKMDGDYVFGSAEWREDGRVYVESSKGRFLLDFRTGYHNRENYYYGVEWLERYEPSPEGPVNDYQIYEDFLLGNAMQKDLIESERFLTDAYALIWSVINEYQNGRLPTSYIPKDACAEIPDSLKKDGKNDTPNYICNFAKEDFFRYVKLIFDEGLGADDFFYVAINRDWTLKICWGFYFDVDAREFHLKLLSCQFIEEVNPVYIAESEIYRQYAYGEITLEDLMSYYFFKETVHTRVCEIIRCYKNGGTPEALIDYPWEGSCDPLPEGVKDFPEIPFSKLYDYVGVSVEIIENSKSDYFVITLTDPFTMKIEWSVFADSDNVWKMVIHSVRFVQ